MAQMDYFRRPSLAGNNITRMGFATVRGSVRRSDADGISAVPYFPGASSTQTLNVKLDGTTYPVTLTGNGITQVIADINAAIGANGTAVDADGTISIQTNTGGANGSAEVTGGTASTGLGFDVTLGKIRSTGGDLPSTPEGRIGNWNGVALPNKGENFTIESVNRALARLSANADVLFSEHMRGDALPKKVTFTTSDRKTLIPTSPTTVRVFNGLGLLSASSSKESLASFFFLVDQVTGLPPASRVVGVVRGTVSGLPPYANATAWAGVGSDGNVLGVDLTKINTSAISAVSNGRVVTCPGADFVGSLVVPGDFASITGATNLSPWSHNGYRWVVEEVITSTTLALRPMSSSELAQVGTSSTEEQPVLELNGRKVGPEIYGSLTVKNGTYTNDVKIIVDPPLPSGATYDLYLSVPGDLRTVKTFEPQASEVANRLQASDLKPLPNALLTAPVVTSFNATQVVLGSGYGRFSGRVVYIPAKTFVAADFSNTGKNYVYWDKDTNEVKTSLSVVKVLRSDPTVFPGNGFSGDTQTAQELICVVTKTGSNITSVSYAGRVDDPTARSITVGIGGQFSKFEDALQYVNEWGYGSANRSDSYPQFEIVLVSDVTVSNIDLTFGTPVKVRGARPGVKLLMTNSTGNSCFALGGGPWYSGPKTFIFEQLTLSFDASFNGTVPFITYADASVIFRDVVSEGDIYGFIFSSNDTPMVVFDTCNISGILTSFFNGADDDLTWIEISNSKFAFSTTLADATDNPIFFGQAGLSFQCKYLSVRDSEFTNIVSNQTISGNATVGTFRNTAIFEGCMFSRTGAVPLNDALLFKMDYQPSSNGAGLIISNCVSKNPTRCFIDSGTLETHCLVENCKIDVTPNSGPAIKAAVVRGCTIKSSGAFFPTLVEAVRDFSGNYLYGGGGVGVKNSADTEFTVISNNKVEIGYGTAIQVVTWGSSDVPKSAVTVHGNEVLVTGNSAYGIRLGDGASEKLDGGLVSGNLVRLRSNDFYNIKTGIEVWGGCVEGNVVTLVEGETPTVTGIVGIRLAGSQNVSRILGNSVNFNSGGYTGLEINGSFNYLVQSNRIKTDGVALDITDGFSALGSFILNNFLSGGSTCVNNMVAGKFSGNRVTGGYFSGPGGTYEVSYNVFEDSDATIYTSATTGLLVQGNVFNANANMNTANIQDLNVVNNIFNASVFYEGNGLVSENIFSGTASLVYLLSNTTGGPLRVSQNIFRTGVTSSVVIYGMPAVVTDNQFISTGSVTVGTNGSPSGAYEVDFRDNYCTSSMTLLNSFGLFMTVSGNRFLGSVAMQDVDRLDGNLFSGGNITATGRASGSGTVTAVSAVGNTILGTGTRVFNTLLFSGLHYRTTSGGTTSFTDCEFSSSLFESIGSTINVTNCRFSSCRFSQFSGTVTHFDRASLSACHFQGAFNLGVVGGGSTHDLLISNCTATSNLTVDCALFSNVTIEGTHVDGHLIMNSVVEGGRFTVSGCTCNEYSADGDVQRLDVIFNANFVLVNNANIIATYIEVTGCDLVGGLDAHKGGISSPLPGTATVISGNRIGTGCYTYHQHVKVVNNTIFGPYEHRRVNPDGTGPLNGSRLLFSGNHVNGAIFTTPAQSFMESTHVLNNTFNATTITTWQAEGAYCFVEGNLITPTNGVTVNIAGSRLFVRDNQILATVNSVAANQATLLQVFETTQEADISGNYINGRVLLCDGTPNSIGLLRFCDNRIYNFSGTHAVSCGTLGGSALTWTTSIISGNSIVNDLSQTTDNAYAAFYFNNSSGTSSRVKFTNNTFQVIGSAYSGSPPALVAGVIMTPAGGVDNIILIGNTIHKPLNLTSPSRTYDYIRFGSSSASVLVSGNLMFLGNNTLGTAGAGRQGELVFPVPTNAGLVSIPQ